MDYHSYKNNQIALRSTVGDDGSPQHEIWAYCMEWLLFRAARSQKNGNVTEVGTSEVIMGRATRREYQKNPREFRRVGQGKYPPRFDPCDWNGGDGPGGSQFCGTT
jgi:hypothetical protein